MHPTHSRFLFALGAVGAMTVSACNHDPNDPALKGPGAPEHSTSTRETVTRDESPHREGVVTANGTTLHYLDWGGSGPALVFIAGLGDNAHVFDDIAPKLTNRYHVVALTRRGYGQSGRPASGYDVNTLVDDDVAMLDALHLGRVYLAAHSIGAQEMTRLAVRYPERVARMVYVDGSLNDRSQSDECQALPALPALPGATSTSRKRPPAPSSMEIFDTPEPGADDLVSFAAFMRFQRRISPSPWSDAMENSWRHAVVLDAEGHVLALSTDPSIDAQMSAGACRYVQEFSSLRAPSLAVAAVPGAIQDLFPWVPQKLSGEALTFSRVVLDAWQHEVPVIVAAFAAQAPHSSTVLIRNSNHYVFVRDQARVVAAIRAFLPSHLDGR
jgi:pimeloyl-ACP methyl ester carboxylesterase